MQGGRGGSGTEMLGCWTHGWRERLINEMRDEMV